MRTLVFASLMATGLVLVGSDTASAGHPYGYPFFPFGFYQPYGAQYGQRIQTPPYFAVNPPVYYGARYARPYGMSPFASPPLVTAPQGFEGRLRSKFEDGEHVTPSPSCNPYICGSGESAPVAKGEVRLNPFAQKDDPRLAKK